MPCGLQICGLNYECRQTPRNRAHALIPWQDFVLCANDASQELTPRARPCTCSCRPYKSRISLFTLHSSPTLQFFTKKWTVRGHVFSLRTKSQSILSMSTSAKSKKKVLISLYTVDLEIKKKIDGTWRVLRSSAFWSQIQIKGSVSSFLLHLQEDWAPKTKLWYGKCMLWETHALNGVACPTIKRSG